jgi:hypothetical protein
MFEAFSRHFSRKLLISLILLKEFLDGIGRRWIIFGTFLEALAELFGIFLKRYEGMEGR